MSHVKLPSAVYNVNMYISAHKYHSMNTVYMCQLRDHLGQNVVVIFPFYILFYLLVLLHQIINMVLTTDIMQNGY